MSEQSSRLDLHRELNPALTFKPFEERRALEAQLCAHICDLLQRGIDARGEAVLVVSGGRTPAALFQCLSEQPLDWAKVWVTLADERWVNNQHADSNERTVREHLLQNRAAEARLISLVSPAETPHEGQQEIERRLARLPAELDVVILGMGEDGHTASFFPQAPELAQALNPQPDLACVAVTPPVAPWARMTLTLPRLLASREVVVHLCGEGKLPVLQAALEDGAMEAMPIRSVLRQAQTPVTVYWAP